MPLLNGTLFIFEICKKERKQDPKSCPLLLDTLQMKFITIIISDHTIDANMYQVYFHNFGKCSILVVLVSLFCLKCISIHLNYFYCFACIALILQKLLSGFGRGLDVLWATSYKDVSVLLLSKLGRFPCWVILRERHSSVGLFVWEIYNTVSTFFPLFLRFILIMRCEITGTLVVI